MPCPCSYRRGRAAAFWGQQWPELALSDSVMSQYAQHKMKSNSGNLLSLLSTSVKGRISSFFFAVVSPVLRKMPNTLWAFVGD